MVLGNTVSCLVVGHACVEKKRPELDHSHSKPSLKVNTHLNVKYEAMKLLEENIGKNLFDLG